MTKYLFERSVPDVRFPEWNVHQSILKGHSRPLFYFNSSFPDS